MADLRALPEPTGEQCETSATTIINDWHCTATWYPQMGGYAGKAWIIPDGREDGCFEVVVWHDGLFPFSEEGSPTVLHHCDPDQFREFANVADQAIAAAAVHEESEGNDRA